MKELLSQKKSVKKLSDNVPQDLQKRYLSLARRIQSAAMSQRGVAIVTVKVVVDAGGTPTFWTEPQVTKIEPCTNEDLLYMLSD